jgi:hypothetical protein
MTRILALLCALFASFGAHAYSGQELLGDCQAAESVYLDKKAGDPYQSLKSARCLAYVSGFADGYAVSDFLARKVDVQLNAFCLPAERDDLQYRLLRAVIAHLERQPPNADAPVRTLVAGALSKAFPCSQ